ncbi:MAG: HNH endonuclease [Actinobacteria bacterium]|nr:HNH endonuclease [Actinomycetota bacterium]
MNDPRSELIQRADALHTSACRTQRELLSTIAEVDRRGAWRDSGARDAAHWVSIFFGLSFWKALRWLAAAHALGSLPRIAEAFERGELGIDKVVELTRFATPETEVRLIAWAEGVSSGAIRRRGDIELRRAAHDVRGVERSRFLSWWFFDDEQRFGLEAELPAAQGAIVARAIERLTDRVPAMPGEDGPDDKPARRADALVALCASGGSADPQPIATTLVVHAPLAALAGDGPNAEIEDGPVIPSQAARRLGCDARIQIVLEDDSGQPVRLGRTSREPSAAMLRQLRYRDRECRFPGCGSRRFTHAHHIVWWADGGRTDLENLVLVCSFHHRLVHEHGWKLTRGPDGMVTWLGPGGVPYRAGPVLAA